IAGQVNVVTKPSLGGFHGNAYGFFTNRALSAKNFFEGSTWHLPAVYPVTTQNGDFVLLDNGIMGVGNQSPMPAPFSRLQSGTSIGMNLKRTFAFFAGERQIQKGREEDHFAVPTMEQRGMFDSGTTGLFVNGTPSFPN